MANDLVKRFLTKDGNTRISIIRDEYAENPRYNTDEPLHCEDWSREYSIELKDERDNSYSDARSLLINLLCEYGKREVIINMLVENGKHMTDGKSICDNALVYERSMRRWVLKKYTRWGWNNGKYDCWTDEEYFDGRKDDIDLCELLESCLDSTIDELCYFKYWTDGVKTASYSFGYNGEVSFSDEISCDSDGICWLEKEEFLKYSGNGEEYWKSKTFLEMDWLHEEIEAWSEGYVFGFEVENLIKSIVNKRYTNVNKDDEEYEEEEWDQTDSCWGFYGDIWKKENLNNIIEQAGFEMEELEEVA